MTNSLNYNNFRHLPFQERMRWNDKTTRDAFRTYCKRNNLQPLKFGVDGTEPYKPYHIHPTLRNAPDTLCILQTGGYVLTELKACGARGLFLKRYNMDQYLEWGKLFNVFVFIYNSSTKKYAHLPISDLASITRLVGTSIDKHMGEIFHIPCEMLEWTPITHEPQYADNYRK